MTKNRVGETTVLHQTFGNIAHYKEVSKMLPSLRKFNQSEVAKERLRIINYYDHYGGQATFDAFRVDRKLIYVWKKRIKTAKNRHSGLVPQSTAPKTKRQMKTDLRIINFISKQRQDHYRLGKEKIKPLLDEYCQSLGINTISESTIGKVIRRNRFFFSKSNYRIYHTPKVGHKSLVKRLRVKKAFSDYGYVQMDTIERIDHGIKQYFYCAIDTKSKFALTLNYKRKTSINTVNFINQFIRVCPIKVKSIQTDNGSEFLGDFEDYLVNSKLIHNFTYPRCPKINGCVERYNRTVQEEFIDPNLSLLVGDTAEFNRQMADYLIWYNCHRPHKTLSLKSPLQHLIKNNLMSNMSVTSTQSCKST